MSKLDDILYSISNDPDVIDENPTLGLISVEEAKEQIKALIRELVENRKDMNDFARKVDAL